LATIYFSGSISSGRADVETYRRIVAWLEAAGHRVLAGSVTDRAVSDHGDELAPRAIFDRDLGWIAEAELLVAEVSHPSTGVGYEIAAARYRFGIPVICLWRPAWTRRCSAMVSGDPEVRTIEYTDATFAEMLEELARAVSAAGPGARK
jgi:hypothetical protein